MKYLSTYLKKKCLPGEAVACVPAFPSRHPAGGSRLGSPPPEAALLRPPHFPPFGAKNVLVALNNSVFLIHTGPVHNYIGLV